MANTKISQLPSYTGSAADLRWFVMNNSGETETFKYSGYSSQLIPGTGADSYRTPTQTAAGTNSIAIGKGAAASGDDSISIGDISYSIPSSAGTRSVVIGKHAQVVGDYQVVIGSAAYAVGSQAIAIGTDTAAYAAGAIVMGSFSRATAQHGITIGNNNDRNIGEFSTIIGYNNRIAEAPNYYGGIYNNIISSNSWINNSVNGIGYNTIIGGYGNYITGTTSGTTLIGLNNYTSPLKNDTAYVNNLNVIGKIIELNTTTPNTIGSSPTASFIAGDGNTITGTGKYLIFGDSNTASSATGSGFGNVIFGTGNDAGAKGSWVVGSYNSNGIAERSFRWGNNGGAQGLESFSWGDSLVVTGSRGFGFGSYSSVGGSGALSFGDNNTISGNKSVAFGDLIEISAQGGFVTGYDNDITAGNVDVIMGGAFNDISSSAGFNGIYNSNTNTISGTAVRSTIIGSINSSITGGTNVIGLGLTGRTGLSQDYTTYTENHASFGQSYQGYFDNGSGSTFTIDWNNGNTQKMSFTGAGGITCNNTQTGAHYRMVINNPNGYTPTSFTAAGRTIKFNGGSFVVYSGESICELFTTDDSVFVNQLGLFS